MMKSLMDGQIMHYLEYNQFYPAAGQTILIPYQGQGIPSPASAIEDIDRALKVRVSQTKQFYYTITNYGDEAAITIMAPFGLFKGQPRDSGSLIATVTKEGQVTYLGP
jgi:hypothetical protein